MGWVCELSGGMSEVGDEEIEASGVGMVSAWR